MNIDRHWRRASALGLFMAVGAINVAHAGPSYGGACTQAVQGGTVSTSIGGSCISTDHVSVYLDGDERSPSMLVQQATANSLVLSYSPVAASYSFGGSGFQESGELYFGPVATVKPAEGFVVDEHTLKAYVTATIYGPANLDWKVFGRTGESITTGYEKTLVLAVSPQDDGDVARRLALSYFAPYGQGPNGSASVFSSLSFTVDKIVISASVVAVPEPATWGLMALGLVGMVVVRRPKKA